MILPYTTILIDMYGVILEQSKGRLLKYSLDTLGQEKYNEIEKKIHEERLFDKAGLGEFDQNEFLTMLGFDNPELHMKNYIENYLTLDKGFIDFAERIKGKYDLVLLSNDVSEWSDYTVRYFGIEKYFSYRTVSADVKCRKPDLKIYDLTLEAIGKAPSECIFIDNDVKNLLAAEEVGISTVLFNRDGMHFDGATVESFDELCELIGV